MTHIAQPTIIYIRTIKIYILSLLISFPILKANCQNINESTNWDSICYRDFNLFEFKGLRPIKGKLIAPYIMVGQTKDSVFLKFYYTNKEFGEKHYGKGLGYYAEKEIIYDTEVRVEYFRFFCSNYILQYSYSYFTHLKPQLGDITKYTREGSTSITAPDWMEPVMNIDLEQYCQDSIGSKIIGKYVVENGQLKIKYENTYRERVLSPSTIKTLKGETIYPLNDFPYNPGYFSFFWNLYLNQVHGSQKRK